jgi:large subunit ribosomal protein L16
MQFFPKKSSFKKHQRGSIPSRVAKVLTVADYSEKSVCLRSTSFGLLTSANIACFYGTVKKYIKKRGIITLSVFPQTIITRKSAGVRMGKGKGSPCGWVARINSGTCLLKVRGANPVLARKALSIASKKIPLSTKIV